MLTRPPCTPLPPPSCSASPPPPHPALALNPKELSPALEGARCAHGTLHGVHPRRCSGRAYTRSRVVGGGGAWLQGDTDGKLTTNAGNYRGVWKMDRQAPAAWVGGKYAVHDGRSCHVDDFRGTHTLLHPPISSLHGLPHDNASSFHHTSSFSRQFMLGRLEGAEGVRKEVVLRRSYARGQWSSAATACATSPLSSRSSRTWVARCALHRILTSWCVQARLSRLKRSRLNAQADCGLERNLFPVVLVLKGDFSITLLGEGAAADLAAAVRWNLCRVDAERQAAELDPLCWYDLSPHRCA